MSEQVSKALELLTPGNVAKAAGVTTLLKVAYTFLVAPRMLKSEDVKKVLENGRYYQCVRWRKSEQKLYMSDQGDKRANDFEEAEGEIGCMNEDGSDYKTVASFAGFGTPGKGELPAGLGWLPDGRLLAATMRTKKLVVLDTTQKPPAVDEYADLNSLEPRRSHDMVVDDKGRAYVGGFGYDLFLGKSAMKPAKIACCEPGTEAGFMKAAEVEEAVHATHFPIGAVITPDGKQMIIAESQANRIVSYNIDPLTGKLSGCEVWADLPGVYVGGMSLDAEGCVWVTFAGAELANSVRGLFPTLLAYISAGQPVGGVIRVAKGGKIKQKICFADTCPQFVQLGGKEGKTLFVCASKKNKPLREGNSYIAAFTVDVPGAERPGCDRYYAGYC